MQRQIAPVDIVSLSQAVKAGNRSILESLFAGIVKHYQSHLFGYLGRMGIRQALAEEIAQETFLRAWTHLGDFDSTRAGFSTWLFTIAHNLALNEIARLEQKNESIGDDPLPDIPCDNHLPQDVLALAQQRQYLQNALREIPFRDRGVLALAYFKELDLAAIARIENCSVAAIKVRIHRAKQRLHQLLEKHHE